MPPLVTLAIILVLALLILLTGVTWLMAKMLLRPSRMSDGKAMYLLKRLSPGDLGMSFEPARFSVKDEQTGKPMSIAGWWIPHPAANGKCVVLIHGYGDAK